MFVYVGDCSAITRAGGWAASEKFGMNMFWKSVLKAAYVGTMLKTASLVPWIISQMQ